MMRVFVLCTGRCGSLTFARAAAHATNYTAAHESDGLRRGLAFPDDHIEVNNRLVWFLGILAERYPQARFVHLTRDPEQTARSYADRGDDDDGKILRAWRRTIKQDGRPGGPLIADAREYVAAVNSLIAGYLDGCNLDWLPVRLGRPDTFARFWDWIGARGDRDVALATFGRIHNPGPVYPVDRTTRQPR